MAAFRCSSCGVNWPFYSDYDPCPECGGKTDRMGNADAIDVTEAISRKRHADFERYYEQREGKLLADELSHITKGHE